MRREAAAPDARRRGQLVLLVSGGSLERRLITTRPITAAGEPSVSRFGSCRRAFISPPASCTRSCAVRLTSAKAPRLLLVHNNMLATNSTREVSQLPGASGGRSVNTVRPTCPRSVGRRLGDSQRSHSCCRAGALTPGQWRPPSHQSAPRLTTRRIAESVSLQPFISCGAEGAQIRSGRYCKISMGWGRPLGQPLLWVLDRRRTPQQAPLPGVDTLITGFHGPPLLLTGQAKSAATHVQPLGGWQHFLDGFDPAARGTGVGTLGWVARQPLLCMHV